MIRAIRAEQAREDANLAKDKKAKQSVRIAEQYLQSIYSTIQQRARSGYESYNFIFRGVEQEIIDNVENHLKENNFKVRFISGPDNREYWDYYLTEMIISW